MCVPSVLRHSRSPFELVFLDIGSLDGTAEYLAGLAAGAPGRVEVVRTVTDQGIEAACREALARARGEDLVLLNNDTVVPQGWLDQLVALASLSPTVGLVGPMSNHAAPPQLVEGVPYRLGARRGGAAGVGLGEEAAVDVTAVDRFAREWRKKYQGKWQEVEWLGGFCLLIKRAVMARVGNVQGQAGLGAFDTDALCVRVRQAGYMVACCKDLFVHHFGSRSFAHGGPAVSVSG
jgi:O-antigen biosynthesis protein